MTEAACFIDANIFMYAVGREHPLKEASVRIVNDLEFNRIASAINTETLQEVAYRFSKTGQRIQAVRLCRRILELPLEFWAVEKEDISPALEIFEQFGPHGLESRDAIHAASMQRHGVATILSADHAFDVLPNVRRIDPTDYRRVFDRA